MLWRVPAGVSCSADWKHSPPYRWSHAPAVAALEAAIALAIGAIIAGCGDRLPNPAPAVVHLPASVERWFPFSPPQGAFPVTEPKPDRHHGRIDRPGLLPRVRRPDDPHQMLGRRRVVAFYQHCADAEFTRLARTIAASEDEVIVCHTTGLSNGPTEAVNLLIEKARRIGHGFRSFSNYRLRLRLTCGIKRQTRPVARGRQPRSAA